MAHDIPSVDLDRLTLTASRGPGPAEPTSEDPLTGEPVYTVEWAQVTLRTRYGATRLRLRVTATVFNTNAVAVFADVRAMHGPRACRGVARRWAKEFHITLNPRQHVPGVPWRYEIAEKWDNWCHAEQLPTAPSLAPVWAVLDAAVDDWALAVEHAGGQLDGR